MYRRRREFSVSPVRKSLEYPPNRYRASTDVEHSPAVDDILSVIGDDIQLKFMERRNNRLLRPIYINAVEVGFAYAGTEDTSRKLSIRGVTIALWYFISRGHQALALLPFCYKTFSEKTDNWNELMELYRMNLVEFTHGSGSDKYVEVNRVAAKRAQIYGGCIVARSQMHNLIQDNPTLSPTIESRLLMPTFTSQDIIFPADGPLGRRGATFLDTIQCSSDAKEYSRCGTQQMTLRDQRLWMFKISTLVADNAHWRTLAKIVSGQSFDSRDSATTVRRGREPIRVDPYQDKIHPPETTPADHRGFSRYKSRYGNTTTFYNQHHRRTFRRHSFDFNETSSFTRPRPFRRDRFADFGSTTRHYSPPIRRRRFSGGYTDETIRFEPRTFVKRYPPSVPLQAAHTKVHRREEDEMFTPSYRRHLPRHASLSLSPTRSPNINVRSDLAGSRKEPEWLAVAEAPDLIDFSTPPPDVQEGRTMHPDGLLNSAINLDNGTNMHENTSDIPSTSQMPAVNVTQTPQFCQLRDMFGFEKAKRICQEHPNVIDISVLVEIALSKKFTEEQPQTSSKNDNLGGAKKVQDFWCSGSLQSATKEDNGIDMREDTVDFPSTSRQSGSGWTMPTCSSVNITQTSYFCQLRDLFGFEKAKRICEEHPNVVDISELVEIALNRELAEVQLRTQIKTDNIVAVIPSAEVVTSTHQESTTEMGNVTSTVSYSASASSDGYESDVGSAMEGSRIEAEWSAVEEAPDLIDFSTPATALLMPSTSHEGNFSEELTDNESNDSASVLDQSDREFPPEAPIIF